MNPLRRLVLSSAALAPLGCATATFDKGIPSRELPNKFQRSGSHKLGNNGHI
jgi:hypothetical protein